MVSQVMEKANKQETEDFLSRAVDESKTLEPRVTAKYIFDMTVSMRNLARDAHLDFLTHLLDMVAEEAKLRSEEPLPRKR